MYRIFVCWWSSVAIKLLLMLHHSQTNFFRNVFPSQTESFVMPHPSADRHFQRNQAFSIEDFRATSIVCVAWKAGPWRQGWILRPSLQPVQTVLDWSHYPFAKGRRENVWAFCLLSHLIDLDRQTRDLLLLQYRECVGYGPIKSRGRYP